MIRSGNVFIGAPRAVPKRGLFRVDVLSHEAGIERSASLRDVSKTANNQGGAGIWCWARLGALVRRLVSSVIRGTFAAQAAVGQPLRIRGERLTPPEGRVLGGFW